MPELVLIAEQPGVLSYFGRGLLSDTFNARVWTRSLSSQSWPPFVSVLRGAQQVEVYLNEEMGIWERAAGSQWMYSDADCKLEFARSDAIYFVPQLDGGAPSRQHCLIVRNHEALRRSLMHFATVSPDRRLGLEVSLGLTRSSFERSLMANSLHTVILGDPIFFDIKHIALMPLPVED